MTTEAMVATPAPDVDRQALFQRLEGTYAGAVSRLVAYVIDAMVVTAAYAFVAAALQYVLQTLDFDVDTNGTPVLSAIAYSVWGFIYYAYPLATTGRTIGMAVVGVRVVTRHGHDIGAIRAAIRVLVLPLSLALFGVGMALILVRKDRRALHDLIAGTAVVYAWRGRRTRRAKQAA